MCNNPNPAPGRVSKPQAMGVEPAGEWSTSQSGHAHSTVGGIVSFCFSKHITDSKLLANEIAHRAHLSNLWDTGPAWF